MKKYFVMTNLKRCQEVTIVIGIVLAITKAFAILCIIEVPSAVAI